MMERNGNGLQLGAVKLIKMGEDTATVGGYGVVFGGVDLEGESFSPDTDYMLDLVPVKLALYDHGQNKDVKHFIGTIPNERIKQDDTGLWVEAELDRNAAYVDAVLELVEKGALGWSSGSVGHLAQREGKSITRWPIIEFSLTPTPAEPRTLGVERIKALADAYPNLKALLPETGGSPVEQGATEREQTPPTIHIKSDSEEQTMSDEQKAAAPPAFDMEALADTIGGAVSGALEQHTKGLNDILERLEKSGTLKDAGYVAPDSEEDHAEAKSFGDFLLAVKYGNTKRLRKVYNTKSLKEAEGGSDRYKAAYAEGGGTTGGYLVPEEYEARLLAASQEHGVVRRRGATQIPVTSSSGKIPALNQGATSFTRGQSAYAGGVRTYWTAEEAALTETEASFNMVEWNIHKLAGYSLASNELIADSAISVESLIVRLFGAAIAAEEDWVFLRGDGVGKPLGILNSPVLLTKGTDNGNFDLPDAMAMYAAFKPMGGSGVWLMNRSLLPDFDSQLTVTQGTDMIQPRDAVPMNLLGYPIELTEMLPLADNDGDALLADFSAYVIFDRAGVAIDFSEHYKFANDQGTWRFTKRLDGMPWMETYITLNDGTTTVSPFVAHND